jgi:hypothetical protein
MIRSRHSWVGGLCCSALVAAFAAGAAADDPPPLRIIDLVGIRPGWVRLYVTFPPQRLPGTYSLDVQPTCGSSTPIEALSPRVRFLDDKKGQAVVDLKSNLAWIGGDRRRMPCRVEEIRLELRRGSANVLTTAQSINFWMDAPASHVTGAFVLRALPQLSPPATSANVAPRDSDRRWLSFPPRIFFIQRGTSSYSILEVEQFSSRGALAVRELTTYSGDISRAAYSDAPISFELAGGGEILPNFFLGPNGAGISRPTTGRELLNPGRNAYSLQERLLPAPPLVSENEYQQKVLDNKGVPRCDACLVLRYDAAASRLVATGDASIRSMEIPLPKLPGAPSTLYEPRGFGPLPKERAQLTPLAINPQGANVFSHALHLSLSTASVAARHASRTSGAVASRRLSLAVPSPQENAAAAGPTRSSLGPVVQGAGAVSLCALNPQGTSIVTRLSACRGFSKSGFRCPTIADPLRLEDLPPPPGDERGVGLLDILTPYPVARDNKMGTCGTHAFLQHVEAVLNRYVADLAPKRITYVDNDAVRIPEPPIQLSMGEALWATWTLNGRKAGDKSIDGYEPLSGHYVPSHLIPDALWPLREPDRTAWLNRYGGTKGTAGCLDGGDKFWKRAFCATEGQPPPSVYFMWSRARADEAAGQNPLRDGALSVANALLPIVEIVQPLGDRRAAEQWIMSELRKGVPVSIGFATGVKDGAAAAPTDTAGVAAKFRSTDDLTWYLPPQLSACERERLDPFFKPGRGHAVNVVGFSIQGSAANPNPVNSYFILQNNWGRDAGYKSFYAMSFAAFRYLATSVRTFRINRACWSPACARPLAGKPSNLADLLTPLPSGAPGARERYLALEAILSKLPGVR